MGFLCIPIPDIQFISLNSFAPRLLCLSYVGCRWVLFAKYGIDSIGRGTEASWILCITLLGSVIILLDVGTELASGFLAGFNSYLCISVV